MDVSLLHNCLHHWVNKLIFTSFILEGIATVLVAISAFFLIYDFPDTAKFLTIEERAWVVHRLKYQGSLGSGRAVAESERFRKCSLS